MSPLQGKFSVITVLLWLALIAAAFGWPAPYGRRTERSGRSYTDIARVINPNPYASVGARNYPGQPFWPQGR